MAFGNGLNQEPVLDNDMSKHKAARAHKEITRYVSQTDYSCPNCSGSSRRTVAISLSLVVPDALLV